MTSAFVLVPEKWYLDKKQETVGQTLGNGEVNLHVQDESRSKLLDQPYASKLQGV